MLSSFRWVLAGQLAGSGRPGLLDAVEEDLAWIRAQGFACVVNLTETRGPDSGASVPSLHFPIEDMHVPTPRFAMEICEHILERIDAGAPVLIHCHAGLGRTGLIAACCLIALGRSAPEALAAIRRINPMYVQTNPQERFLGHFETYLSGTRAHTAVLSPEGWGALIARHWDRLRAEPDLAECLGEPLVVQAHETALLNSGLGSAAPAGLFDPLVDRRFDTDEKRLRHAGLLNVVLGELGQPPLAARRWQAIAQAGRL